jgi:hypothetical protein
MLRRPWWLCGLYQAEEASRLVFEEKEGVRGGECSCGKVGFEVSDIQTKGEVASTHVIRISPSGAFA